MATLTVSSKTTLQELLAAAEVNLIVLDTLTILHERFNWFYKGR